VLIVGGSTVRTAAADFVFFARELKDLEETQRHIELSEKDLKLLNPNTRTCPIFRSRRDAELTKRIYRRVPILIDHNRREGGNPWGIKFLRMFEQDSDAEQFIDGETLLSEGFKLDGNEWSKQKRRLLPLYEGKMFQFYDHRAAGVVCIQRKLRPPHRLGDGRDHERRVVSFLGRPLGGRRALGHSRD